VADLLWGADRRVFDLKLGKRTSHLASPGLSLGQILGTLRRSTILRLNNDLIQPRKSQIDNSGKRIKNELVDVEAIAHI
jgi:hypothetical protein